MSMLDCNLGVRYRCHINSRDRIQSCMMKSCVHGGLGDRPSTSWHVYCGCTDALLATFAKSKDVLVI